MKYLYILLLPFLYLLNAYSAEPALREAHLSTLANCTLQGMVTDPENHPLEGALVFLPELNRSYLVGPDGSYRLQNLPARNLLVKISFLGFAHQLLHLDLTRSETVLNIQLQPSPVEAEEIVVTGGQHSTQHDNAVKIDVLDLEHAHPTAAPNFSEQLTRIPGVDMISKGNGVSKPVIRGLSMNDILILNNGVRFENYQYSSHHPLGIDEFGTDRVEVIKGPASLLYGSDAMGGVLNFIKEAPAAQHRLEGDVQLQTFSNSLGENSSLGLKASGEHVSGGIRFSQKSHADYLQGGGDFLPNSRFTESSAKANIGLNANLGSFRLYYDYNRQNLGLVEQEAIDELPERGRTCSIFYQQLNTHLLSSQNRIFLGSSKLDLNAAWQRTGLAHLGSVDAYELEMQLSTLTYEAKLHLPSTGSSAYVVGVQGMEQANENLRRRETILLPDARVHSYSAFGFVQQTLGRFKLQSGLRFDSKDLQSESVGMPVDPEGYRPALDKRFGSFSGSIGFTYHPTESFYLRSNLASAFRTPNLAELTSNGPHEAIYELGDANLTPEKSLEADLSAHWHHTHYTLDLAGFYNRIDGYIFQAPTGLTSTQGLGIYRYRQADARLYGTEAGLHIHPQFLDWLHLETTYAWVVGRQFSGAFLPFIPAAKWNVELRGEVKRLGFWHQAYVEFHMHRAFAQDTPAPEETATAGYHLFDLSFGGNLSLRKQPVSLNLTISNLLDTKYVDHLSTLKEVGGFQPGRNLVLSLRLPFGASI